MAELHDTIAYRFLWKKKIIPDDLIFQFESSDSDVSVKIMFQRPSTHPANSPDLQAPFVLYTGKDPL